MNTIICGGGGFIGSNLAQALLRHGHRVRCFDRPRIRKLLPPQVDGQIEWFYGDFADIDAVAHALEGCDAVYHLVSTTLPNHSNLNPVYDVGSNLVGSIQLVQAMLERGVGKLVFLSSGGTVYGIPRVLPIGEDHPTDPICSHGINKLAIEKYCRLFHHLNQDRFDYRVFRLSNPYGPYQNPVSDQGAVAVFLHRALRGQPIEIWGDGSVVRDYVYIGDAVEALVAVLETRSPSRVFNLGSGEGRTLNQVVEAIEAVVGREVQRVYKSARAVDVPENVLDITRVRQTLGWAPRTPFEVGLRRLRTCLEERAEALVPP